MRGTSRLPSSTIEKKKKMLLLGKGHGLAVLPVLAADGVQLLGEQIKDLFFFFKIRREI